MEKNEGQPWVLVLAPWGLQFSVDSDLQGGGGFLDPVLH